MIVNAATFRAILRNVPSNALEAIIQGDLARREAVDVTFNDVPVHGIFTAARKGNLLVTFDSDEYSLLRSLATEIFNASGNVTLIDAMAWIAFRSNEEAFQ